MSSAGPPATLSQRASAGDAAIVTAADAAARAGLTAAPVPEPEVSSP